MKSFKVVCGMLLATCALPRVTLAQAGVEYAVAPAHGRYTDAVERSRALIDSVIRHRDIPGLSIAVSVDGQVVWSEGFGYADVEQQTPVIPSTKFRIGSISKTLTAAALGLLVEQGRLDLDVPVQRYVPSFPEKEKGVVTTRLLAGHLAGIRHYNGTEFLSDERYPDVASGLDIFKDDTLLFEPGTDYSYSSYGWNLVSAVIEGASGQDFLPYMREHVIEPLDMRNTVADYTDSIIIGRTGFYVRNEDTVVINAPYVDNSYKWAGGGYLSTPEDLVKFANAHLRPGFLEAETLALLQTPQRKTDGERTNYGMGWRTNEVNGRRTVGHGGGSIGGNAALMVFPEERVVVALTTNISNARFGPVPGMVAEWFIEAAGQ